MECLEYCMENGCPFDKFRLLCRACCRDNRSAYEYLSNKCDAYTEDDIRYFEEADSKLLYKLYYDWDDSDG